MKKLFPYSLTAILILAVSLSGCGGGKSGGPGGGYTGVAFTMVPVSGGLTFPTSADDTTTATVANAYTIAQTEVTYELWKAVYDWATADARGVNKYAFAIGRKGNDGAADKSNQHPVTTISWRDAIVWCNALTEYFAAKGGTGYQCVYYSDNMYATPIRSTSDIPLDGSGIDMPYIFSTTTGNTEMAKCSAKGFRLPTSAEWELAARYRGSNTVNTAEYPGPPYFTKGNSASGATTYYNDVTGDLNYAGKLANDLVAVYCQYWDGSSWQLTGVAGTAEVKSKVNGANSLGLYDMSGNVWEWCFDKYSDFHRVSRGGSWLNNASSLQLGHVINVNRVSAGDSLGFRPVRTQ